jgi:chemotaxis protein CheD
MCNQAPTMTAFPHASRAQAGGLMKVIAVDIADFKVSTDVDSVLVTYALGSCIAVMVYDPVRKAGGMIHYMLPLSETAPEKARSRPAMFADTGIPLLFRAMRDIGGTKSDWIVKVAGGGSLYGDDRGYAIGQRNYIILREIFGKAGVMITAEDVGGAKSRTTRLYIASGRCTILSVGQEVEL